MVPFEFGTNCAFPEMPHHAVQDCGLFQLVRFGQRLGQPLHPNAARAFMTGSEIDTNGTVPPLVESDGDYV
jgi:hypothetical protein